MQRGVINPIIKAVTTGIAAFSQKFDAACKLRDLPSQQSIHVNI